MVFEYAVDKFMRLALSSGLVICDDIGRPEILSLSI